MNTQMLNQPFECHAATECSHADPVLGADILTTQLERRRTKPCSTEKLLQLRPRLDPVALWRVGGPQLHPLVVQRPHARLQLVQHGGVAAGVGGWGGWGGEGVDWGGVEGWI